jgi:adenylylsulfate kinase
MKVLIYGLSGAGKTTLAKYLVEILGDRAEHINADAVREECNDWDFSKEGRERQLQRMRILTEQASDRGKIAIADFICPFEEYRELFDADYEIWVNTITECQYEDTNQMFEDSFSVDYVVKQHRDDYDAREIAWELLDSEFDTRAETAQMLGIFQPWTEDDQYLFEDYIKEVGQVALMVRDVEQTEEHPHHVLDVCQHLRLTLAEYAGKVRIFAAPNITV